jgi:hypothetical protein
MVSTSIQSARFCRNGLDSSISQILAWEQECTIKHTACTFIQSPTLPTRVLDVGTLEHPKMKLRETRGHKSLYTSLSYCWGTRPFFNTTTTNLREYKNKSD